LPPTKFETVISGSLDDYQKVEHRYGLLRLQAALSPDEALFTCEDKAAVALGANVTIDRTRK